MIFNENRKNLTFNQGHINFHINQTFISKSQISKKYSSKNIKSIRVCAKSCLFLFVTWIFEWNKFKQTLLTQSISIIWNNPFTQNVKKYYPLVMTNIAMENGPFIDGLPGFTY